LSVSSWAPRKLSIEGKTRKLDYLGRLYIPDESYQEFPTDSNGFVLDKK